MKRRILAAMMVVTLALGLTACSSSSSDDTTSDSTESTESTESTDTAESTEDASFSVGFLDQAADVGPVIRMREIIQAVVEAAGGELICDTSNEDSADAQVNAVEKLISAGVSGIIMTPLSESILPTIMNMCDENGVYLAITFRSISDEEVLAVLEASEYYAGNTYEDEEEIGYNTMITAIEQRPDMEQVALIALPVGDATSDARIVGIQRACDEYGIEIVAEVRDIEQASDATTAVQNFIAAYPDLDCIAVSSCYDNSAITALPEAINGTGLTSDDICIASCDTGAELLTLFDYGYAISVGGGHLEIDRGSVAVLIVNAIQGNALTEGEPTSISIPYMYFQTAEDAVDYALYVEGEVPIWTSEEISENLLISTNADLTSDDILDYIQSYNLETLKDRHEDLVE